MHSERDVLSKLFPVRQSSQRQPPSLSIFRAPFTREMHLLDGVCIKLETQFTVHEREIQREREREREWEGVRRGGPGLVGNKNDRNHTYTAAAASWGRYSVRRGASGYLQRETDLSLCNGQAVAAVNCTLVLWAGLSDIEAKPFIHLKHLASLWGDRSRTAPIIPVQRIVGRFYGPALPRGSIFAAIERATL